MGGLHFTCLWLPQELRSPSQSSELPWQSPGRYVGWITVSSRHYLPLPIICRTLGQAWARCFIAEAQPDERCQQPYKYAALRNFSYLVLKAWLHCCDKNGKPLLWIGVVRAICHHPRQLAAPRTSGVPGVPAGNVGPHLLPSGRQSRRHASVSPPKCHAGEVPSSTWRWQR